MLVILKVINDITSVLDANLHCITTFIDLLNVFHSVDHNFKNLFLACHGKWTVLV